MIEVTRDGTVAILAIDMPRRSQNVWNRASLEAFGAALDTAIADADVTGIVVTSGKDGAFVAGGDLDDLERLAFGDVSAEELNGSVDALSVLLRRLETCGKPVAAAINGSALGGGFELALACHHRVCADDGSIRLGLPEATLGLLPAAGGTQRLPRMIGAQASLPLLMEGKQLRPAEALAKGLVDAVVPATDLIPAALRWLATNPSATKPWDVKGWTGEDPADLGRMFMVANAMYQSKTHGNYPAGRAVLSCVWEGNGLAMDAALAIEKRYFVSLLRDPVAGRMIRTLFLSLQEANKLARRPADVPKASPTRIGILGAGLMGSGIAYAAARAGIDAVVIDPTDEKAAGARDYAANKLDRAIRKGWKSEADKADLLSRIHPTTDYAELANCDAVVEAVFEDRDVKAKVTSAADAVLGADAVLASNTSTLPITGLAKASSRPDKFIGLHFFSPAETMPLVEVIRGEQTSDATLAHALDLVRALGKTPIVVKDSRGFYTSRVFGTYITEGMAMLAEGISPALIENAGRKTGMPVPPLQLADEVGLGLMYQVGKQTRADLGDAAPANPSTPILQALVMDADRSGRRSGRGFYDYADGKRTTLWAGLADLFPRAAEQPTVDALAERFLATQALEAARCMDEGLLLAPQDADVGAVLGWGFAAWTGGPLSYIDSLGADIFLARVQSLEAAHGDRFRPPALLRQMAADGDRFYAS